MTKGPGVARISLPQGFFASGINCGVRRYRPDLGIIISDRPAVGVGVFTLNQCKAAPVVYSCKQLPSPKIRAIITNSGQANAATGHLGIEYNLKMVSCVAKILGCNQDQVLAASTGVIGQQLEIDKIVEAIPELISRQGTTAESFALSILTTDLVPKTVSIEIFLSGGPVKITGICKGSGMIHPNMGTMLGYFLTDAVLSCEMAQKLLTKANDHSFNMISVDGESSTNDCAFLLANGASGLELISDTDVQLFSKALDDISIFLAQSIARDGEGATKLIEVVLNGAPSLELARKVARGLVVSPLVKTAIHGEDPNWGRILARLGADGAPSHCLEKMALSIQGSLLFQAGMPVNGDLKTLRGRLKDDTVNIHIDLNSGSHSAVAWGCDLSSKYVQINAEYMT